MDPIDTERDAERILRAAGTMRPPIDLGAIAARCRLQIRYRQDLPEKIAGFLYRGPMYDVIVVNARHSWVRRRFTIGHEIGHWYFGDSILAFGAICYDHQAQSERVVDAFAVELLMPRELVCEAWQQGHSVAVLAHQFQVSRAAMKRRLCELGTD
jgi:Zn-dependent peptidase ImmA (M78 family)